MTYNTNELVHYILADVDILYSDDNTLRNNIHDCHTWTTLGYLAPWFMSNDKSLFEFIYQCALLLREMIMTCLRYMTASTEMDISPLIYMDVTRDKYGNICYTQLYGIPFNIEFFDIAFKYINERYKKITRRYKIIEDKLNNTRRLSEEKFKNLRVLHSHRLYDFELGHIWRRYQHRWEETHPQVVKTETLSPFAKTSKSSRTTNTSDNVTIIRPDSFSDKIKRFVREHIGDKMLTIEEFEQITMGWPKTRGTMNEWYDIYQQPGHVIKIDDVEIRGSGYKTKNNKLRSNVATKCVPTNYFPMKHNRKYMLHTVTRHGTYIIDLMFCGKFTYLVAIEANTRYIYSALCNITKGDKILVGDIKSTRAYLSALKSLMEQGMKPEYIIGDGEKCFNSSKAKAFYKNQDQKQKHEIIFISVSRMHPDYKPQHEIKENKNPKTEPYHTSLSIIDRAIRTIRDMAYNMEVPQHKISPPIMDWILREYNNSYHNTLSLYAGFKVTPSMVHENRDLEQRICDTIHAANWNVMNTRGFRLKNGTHVKVYNDRDTMGKRRRVIRPGDWVVDSWERGKYKIKNNTNGDICVMPRFKLDPI